MIVITPAINKTYVNLPIKLTIRKLDKVINNKNIDE